MGAALADYLRDFGPPVDRGFELDGAMNGAAALAAFDAPPPDLDAVAAEAREEGRREALSESAERHEAEIAAERARHREETEALRVRYEQDFAATMATRLDEMRAGLAAAIGDQVAGALAPFLDRSLSERVVASLARSIGDSMVDGETARIAVAGPPGLFEALSARLAGADVAFSFDETDDLDLTVEFDGTVFATRLSEWSEALKEALS